jgi:hypothetical protein
MQSTIDPSAQGIALMMTPRTTSSISMDPVSGSGNGSANSFSAQGRLLSDRNTRSVSISANKPISTPQDAQIGLCIFQTLMHGEQGRVVINSSASATAICRLDKAVWLNQAGATQPQWLDFTQSSLMWLTRRTLQVEVRCRSNAVMVPVPGTELAWRG